MTDPAQDHNDADSAPRLSREQKLEGLLEAVTSCNERLASEHEVDKKPILLKVAPDNTSSLLPVDTASEST